MSEIEIPDQAVRDYLLARFGDFSDEWTGRIESARITLAAAYPAIRSQVLEGVVEQVARGFCPYSWVDAPSYTRDVCLHKARRALGLPSEGEGN